MSEERCNQDHGGEWKSRFYSAGNKTNGDSWAFGISDDGRFVCFLSLASNLVPGDTNGVFDGFVRDRGNGTTTRVTVGTGGLQATYYIDGMGISGDGSTVVSFVIQ